MPDILSSDFPIAKDQYLAFDGLTIKDKIRQRLIQTGKFTDQNYEGSNLSAINDVIAMVFSLLIYNLNQSINEGTFTNAQIYENINRVVKDLDYKPVGHQTASVPISLSAQNLNANFYTIPRYTSLSVAGVKYSFNKDLTFTKSQNTVSEAITDISGNNFIYQGTFVEFPTYTASGNDNEILYVTSNDTTLVDNFNIDVYVKSTNGVWEQWTKTQSLYLHTAKDKVFEVRFNEKQRYEIKFGNNINGKALLANDQVAVYYLKSDGAAGEIGANVISTQNPFVFNSTRYAQILSNVSNKNYISAAQMNNLRFGNTCASTYYAPPESVEQIKQNAPAAFSAQYSLTKASDYVNFVKTNFSNIVQDVQAKGNKDYLESYIKYFYDLGLTQPQLESRALFNQLNFSDTCNFNNVYLFVVPKTIANNLSYLVPAQKSLIIETMEEEKILTSEVVIMDAVYLAVDLALSDSNEITIADTANTEIVIEKSFNSQINDTSIKTQISNIINNYFNRKNTVLGQTIDINGLTNQILDIGGIKRISTRNTVSGYEVDGLRFIIFNPIYGDVSTSLIVGNRTLENFQFPYLFNTNFINRITIQ